MTSVSKLAWVASNECSASDTVISYSCWSPKSRGAEQHIKIAVTPIRSRRAKLFLQGQSRSDGGEIMTVPNTMPAQVPQALFALVYQELRRIARGQRRAAGNPATLDTTALVHEVYLKLHKVPEAESIDRVHFLSLAARAMRQILVDHARARGRLKRGGPYTITGLRDDIGVAADMVDLVALDEALTQLTEFDPRAGQLVEWRIFAGLEIAEIARMQDLTERTVFRDWRRARAFLVHQLGLDEVGA
jgi:RNA polymerase sigma factor (TIGR02999 family)